MRFCIFKIMFISYICIVKDKVVLHNIKNVWENHDIENTISHDMLMQFF